MVYNFLQQQIISLFLFNLQKRDTIRRQHIWILDSFCLWCYKMKMFVRFLAFNNNL